jgi:hypothetical protein
LQPAIAAALQLPLVRLPVAATLGSLGVASGAWLLAVHAPVAVAHAVTPADPNIARLLVLLESQAAESRAERRAEAEERRAEAEERRAEAAERRAETELRYINVRRWDGHTSALVKLRLSFAHFFVEALGAVRVAGEARLYTVRGSEWQQRQPLTEGTFASLLTLARSGCFAALPDVLAFEPWREESEGGALSGGSTVGGSASAAAASASLCAPQLTQPQAVAMAVLARIVRDSASLLAAGKGPTDGTVLSPALLATVRGIHFTEEYLCHRRMPGPGRAVWPALQLAVSLLLAELLTPAAVLGLGLLQLSRLQILPAGVGVRGSHQRDPPTAGNMLQWAGPRGKERFWKAQLQSHHSTTSFVEGTHERYVAATAMLVWAAHTVLS